MSGNDVEVYFIIGYVTVACLAMFALFFCMYSLYAIKKREKEQQADAKSTSSADLELGPQKADVFYVTILPPSK